MTRVEHGVENREPAKLAHRLDLAQIVVGERVAPVVEQHAVDVRVLGAERYTSPMW